MRRSRPAIFVSGPIGVGKTTAARALAEELGCRTWLERYQRNPFLGRFYANPRRWAFVSQSFFLFETAFRETCVRLFGGVLDSSMGDVHHGFNRALSEMELMSPRATRAIRIVYALLRPFRVRPDVVVQLTAPAPVLLERIAVRGREIERGITADYLERLDRDMASHWVGAAGDRVVALDSAEVDFRGAEGRATLAARCRAVLAA